MVDVAGKISVLLDLDTAKFKKGLSEARGRLDKFKGFVTGASKAIAGAGAAGIAAAGGFAVFTKSALDGIDRQSKLARQVGSTTRSIQVLQEASRLSGFDGLIEASTKITKNLADAGKEGKGPLHEALVELNLDAKELLKLPIDERLIAIGEAMDEVGATAGERGAFLREFRIANTDMINTFENGAAAIKNAQKNLGDFGIGLDDVDAAHVEEALDSFGTLSLWITKIKQDLAKAAAPFLDFLSDKAVDAAKNVSSLEPVFTYIFELLLRFGVKIKHTFEDLARTIRIAMGEASAEDIAAEEFEKRAELFEIASERVAAGYAIMDRRFRGRPGEYLNHLKKQMDDARKAAEDLGLDARTGAEKEEQFIQEFRDKRAKFREDWANQQAAAEAEAERKRLEAQQKANDAQKALDELNKIETTGIAETAAEDQKSIAETAAEDQKSIAEGSAADQIETAKTLTEGLNDELNNQLDNMRAACETEMQIVNDCAEATKGAIKDKTDKEKEALDEVETKKNEAIEGEKERLEQLKELEAGEDERKAERNALELEVAQIHNDALLELANLRRDADLLSEEEYQKRKAAIIADANSKIEKAEKDSEDAQTNLVKVGYKERFNDALSATKQLISAVGTENKAAFIANKGIQIGEAVKDTYAAVNKTYAKYGWPLGAIYGALQAAAGFANVRKIAATSYSGGSTGGSVGGATGAGAGGGATAARAAVESTARAADSALDRGRETVSERERDEPRPLDITISGIDRESLFTGEQIETIIESINERLEDGAVLRTVTVS